MSEVHVNVSDTNIPMIRFYGSVNRLSDWSTGWETVPLLVNLSVFFMYVLLAGGAGQPSPLGPAAGVVRS